MKTILFVVELDERYYFEPFINACVGKDIQVVIFDPSYFQKNLELICFWKSVGFSVVLLMYLQ